MKIRLILSMVTVVMAVILNFLINPVTTVLSGAVAGQQFENSNVAYVSSDLATKTLGHIGFGWLSLIILALIWWRPVVKYIQTVVICMILLCIGSQAHAYYDKTDYAEAVMILPNESAFFIPDVGANKDSQAKFGSAEYLDANKIAAKRFTIPHGKFAGSGMWSDYYVPTGRLIIVDRTPYNREWTASSDRGSSAKNQSFPCQSSEGLNVTVEVAIAASVREEDAAKFLYWFGTNPPAGDRKDPNVVFTSVYYGRSLADVMDSVGRGKVQALTCHEIGARSLDKANAELNLIMDSVEKNSTAFLATRGITLDYIGWAGTFTFDDAVQKSVNDKYIAATLASSVPTLQALADIRVKEGLGDGLRSKGLPSSLIAIPQQLLGSLSAMFGKSTTSPPAQ